MKRILLVVVIVMMLSTLFTINVFAANENESNNTAKTATAISTNSTITGNLSSSNDEDWFKITIPKDGVISIDFKHENLFDDQYYWAIALFHSDATTRISDGNTVYIVKGNKDRVLPEFGVPAGTYYVKIEDWDKYSAVNYSFQVTYSNNDYFEIENNNTASKATSVILNSKYYGAITQSEDLDWYKFEIPQDGAFSVAFEHENLFDDQYYWCVEFFHDDGTTNVATEDYRYVIKGNKDWTLPEFGVVPGTYYMKIYPYDEDNYSVSTYRFSVMFKESSFYEKETNNTVKNATAITMMNEYYGTINFSDDVDWYRVVVDNNMTFSMLFDHNILDSDADYWYIEFYNSDGTTYVNNNAVKYYVKGNAKRTLPDITVSAGTYYIKVFPGEVDLSTYSFSIVEKHDCTGLFTTVKNPTCTETGTKEKNCTICGKLLDTQSIPANGHTCNNWVIDKEATCSSEGKRHCICSECGETVSESIPMIAHTVGEWNVTKAPTCHSNGTQTRSCSKCDHTETETLSALTHEFGEWKVAQEASCYHSGTEERECSLCGDKENKTIEQLIHEYGEWEVVSGSKLIPPIVKEKTCIHCADVQSTEDWSYVWVTIVAGVVLLGILIGVINYIRAFKRR